MSLQTLGYIGLRTKNLEDWTAYASRFLGMQLVDKSRGTASFRMDDKKQRLVVHEDAGDAPGFFGWEVADAAALDAYAANLERHKVSFARGSRALAEERKVRDLIVLQDPAGNRLEIFHGAETTTEPFKPGRAISGFRTGPLGMGHAVLHCEKIDDMLPFYRDVLGFHLSDYFTKPFAAYFFHVNPRHHSVAFIESGKAGIHHLMVETCYLDDVGQCYDIAQQTPEMIATTFGRHYNDQVHSFYSWSPSKFMFEYGWGGRTIDTRELDAGGHHPGSEPVGPRALLAQRAAAQRGARASHLQRREGLPPAAQRDGRQLQAGARRLPVVGRHRPCPQDRLTPLRGCNERQRPARRPFRTRPQPMEWPEGALTRIPFWIYQSPEITRWSSSACSKGRCGIFSASRRRCQSPATIASPPSARCR